MKQRIRQFLLWLEWLLRGSPYKTVKGGWCGCCGKWIKDAEFKFRDYYPVDNFWDLNTVCPNGCSRNKKKHS